jgi:hypothetical protein
LLHNFFKTCKYFFSKFLNAQGALEPKGLSAKFSIYMDYDDFGDRSVTHPHAHGPSTIPTACGYIRSCERFRVILPWFTPLQQILKSFFNS